MLRVLSDRHVDPILIEHRRADNLAGRHEPAVVQISAAFTPVAAPVIDGFAAIVHAIRGSAVVRPDFVQKPGAVGGRGDGVKRVTHPVAARRRKPAADCQPIPATAMTIGREIRGRQFARCRWPGAGRSSCPRQSNSAPRAADASCYRRRFPSPRIRRLRKRARNSRRHHGEKPARRFMSNRQMMSASCGPGSTGGCPAGTS